VEHVTSGSTLQKKLVIIAMRGSIRPDLYQDLIITIVKHDTDPEVRKIALEQARCGTNCRSSHCRRRQ